MTRPDDAGFFPRLHPRHERFLALENEYVQTIVCIFLLFFSFFYFLFLYYIAGVGGFQLLPNTDILTD